MANPKYHTNLVGHKVCTGCQVPKTFSAFYPRKNRKSGRESKCMECEGARKSSRSYQQKIESYERNRHKQIAADRQRIYGISPDEFQEMKNIQDDRCAICNQKETSLNKRGEIKELSIDHDHETGKIRGLLCAACNVGIGFLKDDIEILEKAAMYLKMNKEI